MKQDELAKLLLQKNFKTEEVVAVIAVLSVPSVGGIELADGEYIWRKKDGEGYGIQ